jgi:hypothetical protein
LWFLSKFFLFDRAIIFIQLKLILRRHSEKKYQNVQRPTKTTVKQAVTGIQNCDGRGDLLFQWSLCISNRSCNQAILTTDGPNNT